MNYFAIGNNEFKNNAWVNEGDKIKCRHCFKNHVLKGCLKINSDGKKEKSLKLLFYNCRKNSYLAAVNQRLLPAESIA